MTIFGWDSSHYDWDRGSMDIAAAVRDGITFFTHKATESNNMQDNKFGSAMQRAKDAKVKFIGAYHVVRSSPSASTQADYFINYVTAQAPWWKDFDGWFFQADLEKWPYDSVAANIGEQFADAIEQKTGRKCLIYASKGQYGNELNGTSHELWNANYGSNAIDRYLHLYNSRSGDQGAGWSTYSGKFPKIWQYGSQAIIGNQSTCDANAFQGTVDDFANMIGAKMTDSFTDPCTTDTGVKGRTRDNILGDLENVREWGYAVDGVATTNMPKAGSRFDMMFKSAMIVQNWASHGIPIVIDDATVKKIVDGLVAALGGQMLTYDNAVKANQEAMRKGSDAS